MVRASAPHRRGQVLHLPLDGGVPPLLLRVAVTSPTWAEGLPPMPEGAAMTVAFSDEEVEAEHEEAMQLLGYATVGVFPSPATLPPSIDLLIPRRAADRWPVWRDEVLRAGGRVFDLGHGPVAMLMASAVAVHRRVGPEPPA